MLNFGWRLLSEGPDLLNIRFPSNPRVRNPLGGLGRRATLLDGWSRRPSRVIAVPPEGPLPMFDPSSSSFQCSDSAPVTSPEGARNSERDGLLPNSRSQIPNDGFEFGIWNSESGIRNSSSIAV